MSRATLLDERKEEELEATDQLDTRDTVETRRGTTSAARSSRKVPR